jgi:enoyl-CoA hydratase
MSDVLLVERAGGVLVMTLNRPEARNAINRELSLAVAGALDELDASDDLHAGIITGAGGTFSSGMDLRAYATGESIEVEGRGVAGLTRTPPDKPLIAAIEGFALAGGFEMALSCDLLVAADDVVLGLPEVRRGLIAGSGGLLRLSRRMPYALAAEYGLTGRRFGAAEAARWGVVNRVVPTGTTLATALELAAEIGESSPYALAATKTVLRAATELSDAEAWRVQDETLDRVFASEDSREGARAFVEKRPPVWSGR